MTDDKPEGMVKAFRIQAGGGSDEDSIDANLRFELPPETPEQREAREKWAAAQQKNQEDFAYAVEIRRTIRAMEARRADAIHLLGDLRQHATDTAEQRAEARPGLADELERAERSVAALTPSADLLAEEKRARAAWLSPGQRSKETFRLLELEQDIQRCEQRGAAPPVNSLVEMARLKAKIATSSTTREGSEQLTLDWFIRQGIIVPPWVDARRALETVVDSDVLGACVWCMAKNVGGHGYEFVPRLSPAAMEQITDQATLNEIESERLQLERFFRDCNPSVSFLEIRRRSTSDKWSTGWSVWELLRDGAGELAAIEPMWSWTTGLTQISDPVECEIPVQGDDGAWMMVKTTRRFHLVVQVIYGQYRYFKTLGDPRVVDRFNGRVAANDAEAAVIKEEGREAHEVALFIHYGVSGGIAPYGVPPWLGATYSALGRKAAAEVNLLFWDNKGVPPVVFMVSGGQFTKQSAQEIADHLKAMKGRKAFHDALILEAIQGAPTDINDPQGRNQVRIEMKELSQLTEASHREYSKDCIRDVRMPFGLPAISIGLSDDYTRATADAAMVTADREVFQPEREGEDHWINHVLLPYLGIRYWSFKTRGAHVVDEQMIVGLIEAACENDLVTVDEARAILGTYFGHALPAHNAPWSTRPISINKGLAAQGIDFTAEGPQKDPVADVPDEGNPDADPPEQPASTSGGGDGKSGGVEADEAEAAAQTDSPGSKDPEQKQRVFHAKVPAAWLEGAKVIDGVLQLRDKIQQELLVRAVEEARATGQGSQEARSPVSV